MFTNQKTLEKRTGPEGVGRYEYLHMLMEEFHKTTAIESKLQVLANLANFAYDPINYEHMRQLNTLDLFLSQLSQDNEDLLNFGLAGICNACADPENREYILGLNGAALVSEYLLHRNEEVALNALTTLFFLVTEDNLLVVATPQVISKVLHYKNSGNPRLRNLGVAFLEQCTKEQIAVAERTGLETADIPLPAINE